MLQAAEKISVLIRNAMFVIVYAKIQSSLKHENHDIKEECSESCPFILILSVLFA